MTERPDSRGRTVRGALRKLRGRSPDEPVEASPPRAEAPARSMPTLSSRFASMQDFYRFSFMADGYPGRAEPDGSVFAHPIYGTYALADYLKQLAASPSPELAEAIRTVAYAAISKMSEFHGALVFWYEADPLHGARLYEKHYSGLTQGYYAVELHRAGVALDDPELIRAAERAFDSLLIPAETGGVYFESELGCTIAEVPQQPNSWILNGWMSSLTSVHRYAELSGSARAHELFARSARTMAGALDLYDDQALKISRYGLTGFTYLRLRFTELPERLAEVRLTVPGEGTYPVPAGVGTRWQLFVLAADLEQERPTSKTVRMNVVLSLAPRGLPNVLELVVESARGGLVSLDGMRGEYDPRASSPVRTDWSELGSQTLEAGRNELRFELPEEYLEAVVYPTNFVKQVDGLNVNIYHGVHVNRLREIGRLSGIPELAEWADRWAAYVSDWPSMPIYRGLAMRDFTTGKVTLLASEDGG